MFSGKFTLIIDSPSFNCYLVYLERNLPRTRPDLNNATGAKIRMGEAAVMRSCRVTEMEYATLLNRDIKPAAALQISERDVTVAIRQLLWTCGIWHFKHWGGPMGEKGIADIIGCYNGRMIAIEIKKPGGKATGDQLRFLASVNQAGGIGFTASSTEDVVVGLGLQSRFLL